MDELLILESFYNNFLFVFIRIFFFIAFAPVFSASQNVKVKIGLATAVSVLTMGVIPTGNIPDLPINLIFFVISEAVIGIGMAMVLKIVFAITEVAGHAMSQAGGLSFAVNADPQNGVQVPVIGNFLSILTMLLFLSLHGLPISIKALSESYLSIPPGLWPDISMIESIWRYSSVIFKTAFLVSLPIVTAVTMANIAFGIMSRTSPQVNILAIGMPISLSITLLMVLYGLETYVHIMVSIFDDTFSFLFNLYKK